VVHFPSTTDLISEHCLHGAALIQDEHSPLSVQHQPCSPSKSVMPSVSVVVCTRHRPDELRKCLEGISRLKRGPDETLVIDNSEGDAATERTARSYGARYLIERAHGLSRARNRGLAESRSEIVVYIDDDAVPDENWLEEIVAPFSDPQMAIVTGQIEPEGTRRDRTAPVRCLSRDDPQWFEIATLGGLGMGGNMSLRKAVYSEWQGFDPRLGRGAPIHIGEESHAAASLIALGYHAAVNPAAIVHHPLLPIPQQHLVQEAACSIAYWLLLLFEFPGHRLDLIRFLLRRLRGKDLSWPRDPQTPGQMVTSGWGVRLKAGLAGIGLYLHSRNVRVR
jgi:glycosyltransferase involved in cell wall biosynthesis